MDRPRIPELELGSEPGSPGWQKAMESPTHSKPLQKSISFVCQLPLPRFCHVPWSLSYSASAMLSEVWRKCPVSVELRKQSPSAGFFVSSFTFVSSQSNATVTHLELEDNCILAEGAICIAEMLRENSSLQELVCNYDFNQITIVPMQKYSHSESHDILCCSTF